MNSKLSMIIDNKENRLILFYGRPAHGKTRYVSKIILEKAEQNKKSAFVSLEMGKKDWLVKMNILPDDERLKNIDFYGDSPVVGNVNQLKQIFDGKDYDFIVIDYLELMSFDSGETEESLHKLYGAIKEWKCPVLVVSQLCHTVNEHLSRPSYFEEKEGTKTRPDFKVIDISFDGEKMMTKTIAMHTTIIDKELIERLRRG